MKISYMIKREDFYRINHETLTRYFSDAKTERKLYIYPKLNAIITRRPNKAVRKYLYAEYKVQGSIVKKFLAFFYVRFMLNSFGLFAKKIRIPSTATNDTLIYPCNKKYRIFNFSKGTVEVIVKSGFPTRCLKQEIDFRKNVKEDFVLGLEEIKENGYVEKIVDGKPIARVKNCEDLKNKAYDLWQTYIADSIKIISSVDYANKLFGEMQTLIAALKEKGKKIDYFKTIKVAETLKAKINSFNEDVAVSFSHGDLQAGNIWAENGTGKLFIIDWESFSLRSVWYDKAVLFEEIRKDKEFEKYIKTLDLEHCTVFFEDFIYRLIELQDLPENYNSENYNVFIDKLARGLGCV